MADVKREDGYYWVKLEPGSDWEIACIIGDVAFMATSWSQRICDVHEIDERRITRD